MAARRWPRDQKSKPEVKSRDVIKWTSEAQVHRSQWLQQIFEPNLVHSTNTILSTCWNGQIHITWKSKMAAAAVLNFGKMSITPAWIKISAPNFIERCITAMRRWPRDQKSKPEVNSRDVIKWTSDAQVRRSQWLQQIFQPNLVHSTNTILSTRRNGQIHITWKSKMAADIGEIWITLDWIKVSARNLMRRCITTMRRWHMTRSRNQ